MGLKFMVRLSRFTAVISFVLFGAFAGDAQAQGYPVSVDAITQALAPEAAGPVVRSMVQSTGTLPFLSNQQIPAGFDFPAMDLTVEFDSGTHILTTKGMTTLRTLAVALNDPKIANSRFQVAAHLVQQGATNTLTITACRANVVVDHLATFYGIDRNRIIPVGYGSAKMRDPAFPESPANERIELINIDNLK